MEHSGPVRVDGIAIVGAYHGVGHPEVDALEASFLRQHVWFPEHTGAVHFRWAFILEWIPAMRTLHLYNDLSPVYKHAMTLGAGSALFAAYDLSILQHRFWQLLHDKGMTLPVPYGWQLCASQAWQRQLLPRIENQRPFRRNQFGKIKKARTTVPEKVQKWYN